MNDRFADLGELSDSNHSDDNDDDVEMGDVSKDEFDDSDMEVAKEDRNAVASAELNGFFKEVDKLKDSIEEITANIKDIKGLYSQLLTATATEQGKELRGEVNDLRDKTNAIAQEMRRKLKSMKIENDKFQESHKNDPALVKIRNNMHGAIVKRFLALMQEYQQVLSKYDQKIREKAYRQVQLVSPDAKPADIDELLNQGDAPTETIFTQVIMEDRKHKNAQQTLDYLQEKHNDILELEQNIVQLNQLFTDMAGLVATQGELIEQIEYSVMQSEAYTEDAVSDLGTTEKIVTNTRKKKVYICVIAVVIIVVLVVFVVIISGVLPPVLSKLG